MFPGVFSLNVCKRIVYSGIQKLGDIAQCTNLLDLDLHNNALTDMSALVSCKKLERLNLCSNSISSLGMNDGINSPKCTTKSPDTVSHRMLCQDEVVGIFAHSRQCDFFVERTGILERFTKTKGTVSHEH